MTECWRIFEPELGGHAKSLPQKSFRFVNYVGHDGGDYFGLTQFGAHVEILPPGAHSSLRHWRTASDEVVLMLEGELALLV